MWIGWFREREGEPWRPLLQADSETRVIQQTNHARKANGDWMVLPEDMDPNHPQRLAPDGTHYRGSAREQEPAAVVRGRFAARLHDGRAP